MYEIIIQRFRESHPDEPFPWYQTLSDEEAQALRARLKQKLGLHAGASDLELVKEIDRRAKELPGVTPCSESFNLMSVLGANNPPDSLVYFNRHRFDHVDRLKLGDLSRYLQDIWLSAHDADIVGGELKWILCLRHFNQADFLALEAESEPHG